MKTLALLVVLYLLVIYLITTYYRLRKIRSPFKNWSLGWEKDVKFKEKSILALIIQIPLLIIFLLDLFCDV